MRHQYGDYHQLVMQHDQEMEEDLEEEDLLNLVDPLQQHQVQQSILEVQEEEEEEEGEREVEVINNNYHPNQFLHPNHPNNNTNKINNNNLSSLQNLTDETDDGTIENDRVEYAVLLPDSFAILDSTFDDELNYIL